VTAHRPYAELVREAEKARLLLDAARQLGETLEPERVYTRFRELLADGVEHDGVIVSSYEDADGLIRCDYAWSDGEQLDASRLPPLPLNREGHGMQSRVIVTGPNPAATSICRAHSSPHITPSAAPCPASDEGRLRMVERA